MQIIIDKKIDFLALRFDLLCVGLLYFFTDLCHSVIREELRCCKRFRINNLLELTMIAFLIIVAIMMIVITMTMIIILWSECIHKGHQTSASPFAQQCSLVKYKYKYKCKYKYNNMYQF